jgi:hypothetical protein
VSSLLDVEVTRGILTIEDFVLALYNVPFVDLFSYRTIEVYHHYHSKTESNQQSKKDAAIRKALTKTVFDLLNEEPSQSRFSAMVFLIPSTHHEGSRTKIVKVGNNS